MLISDPRKHFRERAPEKSQTQNPVFQVHGIFLGKNKFSVLFFSVHFSYMLAFRSEIRINYGCFSTHIGVSTENIFALFLVKKIINPQNSERDSDFDRIFKKFCASYSFVAKYFSEYKHFHVIQALFCRKLVIVSHNYENVSSER